MSVSDAELSALLATLTGPTVQDSALVALADLKPELLCRVCMEPLPVRDADLGTHPECDPPRPEAVAPPSTVGDLSAALIDYDLSRARSRQAAVGPSEIGVPCDRRLGYALRNIPKHPDGRVPYAPLLGTAFHSLIADALRADNERTGRQRWLIEQRVEPGPEISGSCDAYDLDTATVIDWKLVGQSTVDKARRSGPAEQYQTQAQVYGRGWQRLGHDPAWVRIVFLPRWSHTIDDTYEWTAPYSRRAAEKALQRMRDVTALLDVLDVDNAPDQWATLDAADACYFCPYRRASTGPADATGCPGFRRRDDDILVDEYLATLPTL